MGGRTESRPVIGRCLSCGREGRIEARGLDRQCYDRLEYAGKLEDFPRWQRTQREFVEDYKIVSRRFAVHLKRRTELMARALGYANAASLQKIVTRARKAGYDI